MQNNYFELDDILEEFKDPSDDIPAQYSGSSLPSDDINSVPEKTPVSDGKEESVSSSLKHETVCPVCGGALRHIGRTNAMYCPNCSPELSEDEYDDLPEKTSVSDIKNTVKEKIDGLVSGVSSKFNSLRDDNGSGKKQKILKIAVPILLVLVIAGIIVGIILAKKSPDDSSKKDSNQETQLNITLTEVQNDISAGKLDEALAKANTLYYTAGDSAEAKAKWDKTREDLIAQINVLKSQNTAAAFPAESSNPAPSASPQAADTPVQTSNSAGKYGYHSSGDLETAKQGNSGVYAYKKMSGKTDTYWIIDFAEGYVYYFTHGDGSTNCQKIKISSGDLNTGIDLKVNMNGRDRLVKIYFYFQKVPDHLIVEETNASPVECATTNLADALALRDKMTIVEG